jgi:AraC-like DNA-binding protein
MSASLVRSGPSSLQPLRPAAFLTRYLRPGLLEEVPGTGRLHEEFQVYRAEAHSRLLVLPTGSYRTTFCYVLFITHGHFEALLGPQRIRMEAGHLLFVPAGSATSLLAFSDDVRGYFLLAEPAFLTASLNRPGLLNRLRGPVHHAQPLAAVPPEQAQQLAGLFEVVLAEFASETASAELLHTLLRALLLTVERHYGSAPPAATSAGPGQRTEQQLTLRFLDLLAAHYRAWHTVAAYAGSLCVTPNHLNRCVKHATGRPALTWITDTLVAEAKTLLGACGYSVAEAARELGFPSVSYFGRLFRRHTGHTPSAYREDQKAALVLR